MLDKLSLQQNARRYGIYCISIHQTYQQGSNGYLLTKIDLRISHHELAAKEWLRELINKS